MQTTIPSRVLTGAVLPRSAVVTTTLVIGFALLTALAAQIVIPLPFTPVPITGQTFVVLLAGAGLGATAGAASQGLYVLLGAVGLPFYAGGASGWTVARGATGGYLIGFIVAAWIVGALAGWTGPPPRFPDVGGGVRDARQVPPSRFLRRPDGRGPA